MYIKVYLEIKAVNSKKAIKEWVKKTGFVYSNLYTERTWIRICGMTQAEFWGLKKYKK